MLKHIIYIFCWFSNFLKSISSNKEEQRKNEKQEMIRMEATQSCKRFTFHIITHTQFDNLPGAEWVFEPK